MAGLDPAIHVELDFTRVFMDGPIKPGHDKLSISSSCQFFTRSFAGMTPNGPAASSSGIKGCFR